MSGESDVFVGIAKNEDGENGIEINTENASFSGLTEDNFVKKLNGMFMYYNVYKKLLITILIIVFDL